jgi:uncharacterized membrane protein HdeD (DUF308 family)
MEMMAKYWWLNLIRGLVALALGIILLAMPAIFSIYLLVMFVGAYFLVDGIFALIFFLAHPKTNHRWWIFVEGIAGILAAVVVFVWPGMTAVFLLYFIAFWALITGVFEIIYAIGQWKTLKGKGWILTGGILSIIVGCILLSNPVAGALALMWVIAFYLVLFGIMLIVFSFMQLGKGKSVAAPAGS